MCQGPREPGHPETPPELAPGHILLAPREQPRPGQAHGCVFRGKRSLLSAATGRGSVQGMALWPLRRQPTTCVHSGNSRLDLLKNSYKDSSVAQV